MTIGLIARLDNSGLGTLCWEFARHIEFDQVRLVSNNRYKVYKERGYNFVDDLTTDVVLSFETFYGIPKKNGQRYLLVPMYECTTDAEARLADRIISPSLLDHRIFKTEYIPIPIARDRLPFKERYRAETFIHNAGHGGIGGRNGTKDIIESMRHLRSNVKIIINSQVPIECDDKRVEVRVRDVENYWENWGEGEVFLFPERFNGLSLPIQEAMSVGLPIMSTDRFPFNAYLPRELLIKPVDTKVERISREFISHYPSPRSIAQKIDEWAFKDMRKYSQQSNQLADLLSWEKLKSKWKSAIQNA